MTTRDASSQPNYWDYLKLDQLLELQQGFAEQDGDLAPDELHFIIVHQAYELWFKLMLRELRLARNHLDAVRVEEEDVPNVVHHLRRVNEILKLAGDQFRVVETLTPQDFLDFRDKLAPASGFQSFQLREIEILMGLESSGRQTIEGRDPLELIRSTAGAGARFAWERIERARQETSLRAALHKWLYRTPIHGSKPGDPRDENEVSDFLESYLVAYERLPAGPPGRTPPAGAAEGWTVDRAPSSPSRTGSMAREFLFAEDTDEQNRERIRRIRASVLFIESYRDLPLLAWPRLLIDTILELEELLILWRTRHARMVERMIGRRAGTGGSRGVEYLDETARYRIFVELWSARTLLLPKQLLPALRNRPFYEFATP